ncbi:MAG: hypothetical protein AAF514_10505, partial [Verrucomicrobiota bacterium]
MDRRNETTLDGIAIRTLRIEMWRSGFTGVLETVFTTFAILILVDVYESGSTAKSLLISASRGGLLAGF